MTPRLRNDRKKFFSFSTSFSDREGWLWKQGGRYKTWKRRWFILNDNCLYYFEFTTDKEPRGIIPLENIRVREVPDRSKPHCFELYSADNEVIKACKTDSEGKVVEGDLRSGFIPFLCDVISHLPRATLWTVCGNQLI